MAMVGQVSFVFLHLCLGVHNAFCRVLRVVSTVGLRVSLFFEVGCLLFLGLLHEFVVLEVIFQSLLLLLVSPYLSKFSYFNNIYKNKNGDE